MHYLFADHCSAEPGHGIALAHPGLEALFSLEMHLGESMEAALVLPILEAATRMLNERGLLHVG